MKIKCPACSKVLNVPDSAAGKVIKCPCGKQLKAPSQAATPKPAAPSAGAGAAGARAGTGKAATPRRTAPGAGGFDASMLDELTDQDLTTVKAVSKPGTREAKSTIKKGDLSKYERAHGDEKNEFRAGAAKEIYSSIGILLLLGVLRLGFNVYFLMNVDAEVDGLAADPGFEGEEMDLLLTLVKSVYIINIVIGAIFVICAALIFKFPLTCAFTAIVTFVISEIIGLALNPFRLFSIGGWIARAAIFGGLVQTINNASYYKFVKAGGRDSG